MAEPGLKPSLWVCFRADLFPLPCLASVYSLDIIPVSVLQWGWRVAMEDLLYPSFTKEEAEDQRG